MCRDDDHGGRRCPGDTADARRARRYAAASKSRSAGLVESSVRPAPPSAPEVDERPEVEVLAERAEKLRRALAGAIRLQDSSIIPAARRQALSENPDDRDAMMARADEIVAQAIEVNGLADYASEDGIIHPLTARVRWDRAEQEVVALGAATSQWLDGQLLEQSEAVAAAEARHSEAEAAAAEARKRMNEAFDAHPAKFLREGMTEDEVVEVKEHNRRRSEVVDPVNAQRNAAETARVQAEGDLRAAKKAYYVRKRELLGEIRPMGGSVAWTDGGVKTDPRVDAAIQNAASMLPSDWIEASNSAKPRSSSNPWAGHTGLRPMRVRESKTRNHYNEHKEVTRRTVEPMRHNSAYLGKTREEYLEHLSSDPSAKIIDESEWTDRERENASYDGVVYQDCDVAYPGRVFFSTSYDEPNRKTNLHKHIIVNEDGTLKLTGARARGWERHEFTNRYGEQQVCWRKPRTRATVEKEYGLAELTIPTGVEDSSTTLHELTHRCEDANRTIGRLESAFIRRRTTNEDGEQQEREVYQSPGKSEQEWESTRRDSSDTERKRAKEEWVRPDSFVDRYIGKDYGTSTYFEVMTMGNEIALYGRCGGFGKVNTDYTRGEPRTDDDHHAFVLGTLLAA